jgi:hypothetical protein
MENNNRGRAKMSKESVLSENELPNMQVEDEKGFVPVDRSALWNRKTIGQFLESRETQLVLIALIALDVLSAILSAFLEKDERFGHVTYYRPIIAVVNRILQSFTGFTVFVFLIELTILLLVFRLDFFGHAGYSMDLGIVVLSLTYELQHQSTGTIQHSTRICIYVDLHQLCLRASLHSTFLATRVLGILRFWRIFRLVNTLILEEKLKHDRTLSLLTKERLVRIQNGSITPYQSTYVTCQNR